MLLLWLAITPVASKISAYTLEQTSQQWASLFQNHTDASTAHGDYMTLKEYFNAQSLDPSEILLYQHLFVLQHEKKWAELDKAARNLKRNDLMPWLLAERYADPAYQPEAEELIQWLASNEYMPQAPIIQKRLARLDPSLAASFRPLLKKPALPAAKRPQPVSLFTNMTPSQRSVMEGALRLYTSRHYGSAFEASNRLAQQAKKTLPGAWWIAGLSAQHLKNTARAYDAFATIARWAAEASDDSWTAQSNYWAYRLALKLGNEALAAQHLETATRDRSSFYGMLANAAANEAMALNADQVDVSTADLREPILQLISMTSVLHDVGQIGEAEKLLRSIFTRVEPREQQALIWTASNLQLSNIQLPLASKMAVSDLRSMYPMPSWSEDLKVDPALVLAIVRRESGFDPNVGSQAGAQGLMQIIPSTFHYMVNKQSALDVEVADGGDEAFLSVMNVKGGMRDPKVNLQVGQTYLKYLQAQPYIGENLVYLIAAYNAGPGSMQAWADQYEDKDPLLFIESIPYAETRDYVKNVMADYWIYSNLLDRPYPTLETLSQNQWPQSQI